MDASGTPTYLNDSWTIHDRLNYSPLCDQLVALARTTAPPFACAVYGGWGSGKTSLLRSVQNRLGGNLELLAPEDSLLADNTEVDQATRDSWDENTPGDPLPCVWFNPWQHQFDGHPLVALLHEIRNQFSLNLKRLEQTKKIGNTCLKTGLRLIGDLIGVATKGFLGEKVNFSVDQIEATGIAYENERFMGKLDSQRFQMHFEAALAHLANDTAELDPFKRVVIFIDDLDRCESGQVLKLLESIKLYLSTRTCVFFFGLDPDHIETALCKEGLRDAQHARAYLQKMFQLTLHLPKPNTFSLIEAELEAKLKPALQLQDAAGFASLLAEILENNPRRVKNFLNQLLFQSSVYQAKHRKLPKGEWLALLLALRNYFPLTYAILEGHPEQLEKILNSLRADRPDVADDGFNVTIVKETYLPQMELKRVENQRFMALDVDHYANSRALFLVLDRFKSRFINLIAPMGQVELLEYLKP